MKTPAISAKIEQGFAPVRELNKLALEDLEKLVKLQLASVKTYSELALGQIQAASEAKGIEDVSALFTRQYETAQKVAEKLVRDTKNVMDFLGDSYVSKLENIVKRDVKQASVKVA